MTGPFQCAGIGLEKYQFETVLATGNTKISKARLGQEIAHEAECL
jgi:hypothetical protein